MSENHADVVLRSALQPLSVESAEHDEQNARRRAQAVDYTPAYERPPSRRPAEQRDDAFRLSDWLFDGAAGLVDEILHHDLWLPEEFWVHANAAQQEGKLALGIAVDTIRHQLEVRRRQELERVQRRERRGDIQIEF